MNLASVRETPDEATVPSVLKALNALRVAITVIDHDERLVFASQHINYLFRSLPPRESLAGQRYEDLLRLIGTGETGTTDIDGFAAHHRSQLTGTDRSLHDLHLADGRIVEIKARRTPDGWIALWTDVTAARHAMARLQTAISLTADAFAFFDRNDVLVLCNEDFARAHGATVQEIAGRSFAEIAQMQAASGTIVTGADWLKRRMDVHGRPAGAMTIETADGNAYLVRDRATADGGRVVVMTDVTEHRRAENALSEQTRTLDRTRQALAKSKAETERQAGYLADLSLKLDKTAAAADTAKTTLLRTMSHELKTPLNAIIGFSDLLMTLADRAGPEQVKEYAGLIQQGGRNLLRLINQILDLTKISAGRYPLQKQPVDAGMALCQARDSFEGRAAERDVRLDADGCTTGLFAMADHNAVAAMIVGLVENAVQFTRQGGTVRLAAAMNGNRVRIAVADDGPGVAADDLARILLPFEQVAGGTEHAQGAGLGLTLVKALAELQGGTLTVESTHGAGFTATVDLPAAT